MSPAQKRIQAAARLDAERNAAALGLARERCIPDAVDRLTAHVLIQGYEFILPGPLPAAACRPPSAAVVGSPGHERGEA